ncbi:hypothetical protein OG792_05165 [Micromonospora sp. NBC_01699]|uniref:hypothetical protein n=1 Tax=Micromonospora sp. NBC_01699 TaxID=2975984 RepID=UPI002E32890A|nr:hypothetical protein [Micromonospora sp. NBC_01699]
MALDGVEEFLSTCCAGAYAWPHEPAAVDYQATEGRSWRLLARSRRRTQHPPSHARQRCRRRPGPGRRLARGTAGELVLVLYGRIPVDSLKVDGGRRLFDLLLAWNPDE